MVWAFCQMDEAFPLGFEKSDIAAEHFGAKVWLDVMVLPPLPFLQRDQLELLRRGTARFSYSQAFKIRKYFEQRPIAFNFWLRTAVYLDHTLFLDEQIALSIAHSLWLSFEILSACSTQESSSFLARAAKGPQESRVEAVHSYHELTCALHQESSSGGPSRSLARETYHKLYWWDPTSDWLQPHLRVYRQCVICGFGYSSLQAYADHFEYQEHRQKEHRFRVGLELQRVQFETQNFLVHNILRKLWGRIVSNSYEAESIQPFAALNVTGFFKVTEKNQCLGLLAMMNLLSRQKAPLVLLLDEKHYFQTIADLLYAQDGATMRREDVDLALRYHLQLYGE